MNSQEAFLEMLVAAMKDAALNFKLTQLKTQLDPTETGKGPIKLVRIIVVPEEMDMEFQPQLQSGAGARVRPGGPWNCHCGYWNEADSQGCMRCGQVKP